MMEYGLMLVDLPLEINARIYTQFI